MLSFTEFLEEAKAVRGLQEISKAQFDQLYAKHRPGGKNLLHSYSLNKFKGAVKTVNQNGFMAEIIYSSPSFNIPAVCIRFSNPPKYFKVMGKVTTDS